MTDAVAENQAHDMIQGRLHIRNARPHDLDSINQVVRAALTSWDLPERVKRLTLSSYLYNELDLRHLRILIATVEDTVVGLLAIESEHSETDVPADSLLIHGLFVDPAFHHQGIGTQLFRQAQQLACRMNASGLLVRAHKDAQGFFTAMDMQTLPVLDTTRDYALRYWKAIDRPRPDQ